jgi:protocatechuate 3,4-dioxygenase beta subunit
MKPNPISPGARRRFLSRCAALPVLLALPAAAQERAPTPACGGEGPTPPQTEGPFFAPASPQRSSLIEPGLPGRPIVVSGTVLSARCRPLPGVLLDFWQADDAGTYDNVGHRLRGHQFSDAEGRYRLESIVPGLYPGRTRHYHVKVQARGGRVLTTQLYFPGEARNTRDGLFRPELLMATSDTERGRDGRFNFVLRGA